MECISNEFEVTGVETTERNSAISSHINMVFVLQSINLFSWQSSVGKHTNLTGNMAPIMYTSCTLQTSHKTWSHFLNSSRHSFQILMPAFSQFWVAQNNINDSSSMNWWVRIHWSCNSFNSWLNLLSSSFILSHQREATNSLTIQTKVLGEWLRKGHSIMFLSKES